MATYPKTFRSIIILPLTGTLALCMSLALFVWVACELASIGANFAAGVSEDAVRRLCRWAKVPLS